MIGVAVCLIAERALNILIPRQLGIIVNLLGGKDAGSFKALGFYVLFTWLNSWSGIQGLRNWLWIPVESNARRCLETASYNHIMDLSCDFHDDKKSGELYSAMKQGTSLIDMLETLLYHLVPIVFDLFLALGYFYFLFESYLVLIGAATMIFYFWGSIYLTTMQVKVSRKTNGAWRKQYQVLHDTMGQWRTVSTFNRFPHAKRLYSASTTLHQKLWTELRYVFWLGSGVLEVILDAGSYGAFFFAAYQVVVG
ncbi:MAG: ABC transporter transmembrane domain-containing protein, partial [Janthinobacterium lividum]